MIAVGLNEPLAGAFAEGRPHPTRPDLLPLGSRSSDFSFPSNHAVMAGAVAAVLMAFARVYVGVHYPWDVAAGLVFGALVALLGWTLLRVPLTTVTGWLRDRPGLRQTFPAPAARQAGLREPRAAASVA